MKLTGGGIKSNKTVQSRGYKTEPKPKAANIAGVAQQGISTAFAKEPLFMAQAIQLGPKATPE